jgi:pyrroloquinoline quinone (PQQ) biosynthesis protein C
MDKTVAAELILSWEKELDLEWKSILADSPLVKLINTGIEDRRLYGLYLRETFHYTRHNSRNQALVVQNIPGNTVQEIQYAKYCLNHALEETGHEFMALHDLNSLGIGHFTPQDFPEPLPETRSLIHYLYSISESGNPYQRLGYSFWAEGSYRYFQSVLSACRKNMQLANNNMTFFVQHSDIDDHHYQEIKDLITSLPLTTNDCKAINKVMIESLQQTAQVLSGVCRSYESQLKRDKEFKI